MHNPNLRHRRGDFGVGAWGFAPEDQLIDFTGWTNSACDQADRNEPSGKGKPELRLCWNLGGQADGGFRCGAAMYLDHEDRNRGDFWERVIFHSGPSSGGKGQTTQAYKLVLSIVAAIVIMF